MSKTFSQVEMYVMMEIIEGYTSFAEDCNCNNCTYYHNPIREVLEILYKKSN